MKWKDALPAWLGMEETPPGLPLTEIGRGPAGAD